MKSVAIVVTTFRAPARLSKLLDNMIWSGLPDVPLYVFEDPSHLDDRSEITRKNTDICHRPEVAHFATMPEYGCMQGAVQFAMSVTHEDWMIYVPDDVLFSHGALWNEYAATLAYGRDFVGAIQAPFWEARDLVAMGIMPCKQAMFADWHPRNVPRNPLFDLPGGPKIFPTIDGAGFSLNRELFNVMGGFPQGTYRFDHWTCYQAWKLGMVTISVPGPTRIHYGGASTELDKPMDGYSGHAAWMEATGGKSSIDCCREIQDAVDNISTYRGFQGESAIKEPGSWNDTIRFFSDGHRIVE